MSAQSGNIPNSPSCYIVSLINIDNWPCLKINNFQQMNQTRSLAENSTLHNLRALQVLGIFCKPIDSMLVQSIESMGLQKIPTN